ncbi:hypothetical protein PILCRDRAFT_6051 [Piloderma croceum F 1598]|uniref:Arrestin-like N-terminal domain-containing protein n=1 Tax=Piloderma croceum (strain F 1598) TaxID=765440 RepID=A0A0C3FLV7_PILCF|nr:hypothetical protein PILCRDRAFT_6051 [Piloderma croceum F 1598]
MVHSLPSYSSPSTPRYSSEPSVDEQTLDHTPVVGQHAPTGTYVKSNDIFTLTLDEQVYGAVLPTYGRNGLIKGTVSLHDCAEVTTLNVKASHGDIPFPKLQVLNISSQLDGILNVAIADGRVAKTTFLTAKHIIWSNELSLNEMCPSSLPFECALPSMYQERGRVFPLPPSYEILSPGDPKVAISCDYTLTVEALKAQIFPLIKRRKSFSIRISYQPRTRPVLPILPSHITFLSTIKTSPKEWYRITSTMQPRHGSGVEPIQCNLYIPSAQIYAISDVIGFHVQLRASPSSLWSLRRPPNSSEYNPLRQQGKPIARVFIMRQIIATVYGHKARRYLVIGEGNLRPLPPIEPDATSVKDGLESLDWEGDVRCDESVTGGALNVGDLSMKVRRFLDGHLWSGAIDKPLVWPSVFIYAGLHRSGSISAQF